MIKVNISKLRGDETRFAFARRSGIQRATLRYLERGVRQITASTLEKLAIALNCSPQDVLQKHVEWIDG